jgi:predicted alpha-1,2-mannosidase
MNKYNYETMKKLFLVLSLFLSLGLFAQEKKTLVDYVNPIMGTASVSSFSHGNTYPAVAMPWGMNFWSPQTGKNRSGWMYSYFDKAIRGFRQTHQPSPWINDYATFSVMPIAGELRVKSEERGMPFSHKEEISTPYNYKVTFENGTTTEFSATHRGSVFSIKYPKGKKQYFVLDAYDRGSSVKIDKSRRQITGYVRNNHGEVPSNFANYYIVEFSHPIISCGTMTNGEVTPNSLEAEHNHTAAYVEFDIKEGENLTVRIASSFISPEQAQLNFDREVKGKSLAQIKDQAKNMWNEYLGRITVEGGTEEQFKVFYSCLYRTLLFPREFFEYNKENKPVYYSPYDGKIHNGYMYTDNGFWDTFRAVHPLFTMVYPEVTEKVTQSLVNAYNESGFMPEWCSPGHRPCMIGNNSISLLSDAWMKGIRTVDAKNALEAMVHQTQARGHLSSVGRDGFEAYDTLGYVPYPDYREATAKTLEYAYNDWCLARFAASIGEKEIAKTYYKKSRNFKHLFDKKVGFMRAKNKEGKWIEPFDATEWGGPFTEGSSWHYTWSVFHDPEALAQLMGGHAAMESKLDSMFKAPNTFKVGTYGHVIHEMAEMEALNMGQYGHGNQPIQHAIYLYNYVGTPWKAQYHVRNVLNKLYNSGEAGYCGDEDNGQTSAWYVQSAMGFYSVCPGMPEYVMGAPLFKKVTINLPKGKTFIIESPKNSAENIYIKSAKLNKKKFTRNYLTYDEIMQGGMLKLKMNDKPNTKRGTTPEDAPYSYSIDQK